MGALPPPPPLALALRARRPRQAQPPSREGLMRTSQRSPRTPSKSLGKARSRGYQPCLETLEDRRVPAVSVIGTPAWTEQGPLPFRSDSVQLGNPGVEAGIDDVVSGAIGAVAVHPQNPNLVYV